MSVADARSPLSPPLRDALARCRALLDQPYARADGAALRHQRWHRRIVDVVAICATLAVLAGIAPLTHLLDEAVVRWVEVFSAFVALVAVVLGLWSRRQRRWLLERHKAEQMQMLEYRALFAFVTDGWCDAAVWERALRDALSHIERDDERAMHRWLGEDNVVEPTPPRSGSEPAAELVRELAAYYRERRLKPQAAYFDEKARRNAASDERTRQIIPALFFVSVGAIIPAAAIRLAGGGESLSASFIVVAAVAPALAGAVRLYRSAHEFSRNALRFHGKRMVLMMIGERLGAGHDPALVLRDLWNAEEILNAEHREWLRLMIEAEWYG